MSRNSRTVIAIVLVAVLAADLAALGFAFTRGGGSDMPRLPGRVAVRAGCGLDNMWLDGSDRRTMCLQDVFDEVSLSWDGRQLAWDTKQGGAIFISGADGANPFNASLPLGTNVVPSLAPDGKKVAFLHSPRDDGLYDIWVTSTTASNAEQVTNTRNVSDVVWSPKGDWIAYVQNWSEETLEGQVSLVRPSSDDAHTLVGGDAPDWSPDGEKIVYVHNGGLWTINADGTSARLIVRDGHSPAWSRDGKQIAFLRIEKCAKAVCPEKLMVVNVDGTDERAVGPDYPGERRVLWLPDPFE
jgi:Tol biopolymer transport system component